MTEYRLVASSFKQALERDDKGVPTKVAKHRAGDVFTITDTVEAERLLRTGAVVLVDPDEDVAPEDVAPVVPVADHVEVTPVADPVGETVEVKRPARNDPRPAWIAYARAKGADEALLEDATKADLIDAYGDE